MNWSAKKRTRRFSKLIVGSRNPVSCSGSVLNFRGHSVMHDAISSPLGGYRAAGEIGLRHTHIAT